MKIGDTVRVNASYGGAFFEGRSGAITRKDDPMFGFDWVVSLEYEDAPSLEVSFLEKELTVIAERIDSGPVTA